MQETVTESLRRRGGSLRVVRDVEGLSPFWATFSMSTPLRGRSLYFLAPDRQAVIAYMDKHFKGTWAEVYSRKPQGNVVNSTPETLFG